MITKNSYAKINLYLDVLDKRLDGYHNIKSVMQSISLFDTLSLEITDVSGENEIEILCNSSNLKCDNSNLIYKAFIRFFEKTQIKGKKCTFSLEKNIPISAGMAGGSSNAATTLLLLNEACGYPLDKNGLLDLASKIGADVAFCLYGGTCLCEGIGEKITPLNSFKDAYVVCAIDNSNVSTPVAFSMLDEKFGTSCTDSANISNMLRAIKENDLKAISSSLYNKFENVIIPTNKNIELIKETLIKHGAIGALMSGSGPSVFGLFENEEAQKSAYIALKSDNISAFLCKTL
jgi:4-diphosphocytidyl-2-C-methyl-D-erythritol kinase